MGSIENEPHYAYASSTRQLHASQLIVGDFYDLKLVSRQDILKDSEPDTTPVHIKEVEPAKGLFLRGLVAVEFAHVDADMQFVKDTDDKPITNMWYFTQTGHMLPKKSGSPIFPARNTKGEPVSIEDAYFTHPQLIPRTFEEAA